jgi:phosphoribosylanthranilate isomerase
MFKRTRIKVCGITRTEDALAAVDAGVDAIGFVFYEPSPRAVSVEQAREITRALPPFVSVVALFVNAHVDFVEQVMAQVPVNLLQFHGYESAAECERYDWPYIKAIRMRDDLDLEAEMQSYPGASGFLLDAYRKGVPGGTGEVFDWHRVPASTRKPIILAGGLNPDNVAEGIATVAPFALDVSGGVEIEPGIKDHQLINRFIANCR